MVFFTRSGLILFFFGLCGNTAWAEEETPPAATVLVIGELDGQSAFEGAEKAGGAHWRIEHLRPQLTPDPDPPQEMLERLAESYTEAEFLRCQAKAQQPALRLDLLLEHGHRQAAGQVATYAAACAHGAGDHQAAREILRRALVAALPVEETLDQMTPEFQLLAEEVQASMANQPRSQLRLRSRPSGARIWIDGDSARCSSTPCEVSLLHGEHVIVAKALGYRPRFIRFEVRGDEVREVSIDRAPADLQREQLADALARDMSPGRLEVVSAAADAFGTRIVLLLFDIDDQLRLSLYDRGLHRVVARASSGPDRVSLRQAAFNVVQEWRGVVEPTPMVRRASFWLILTASVVLVSVGVGLGVWAATREPQVEHVVVFP